MGGILVQTDLFLAPDGVVCGEDTRRGAGIVTESASWDLDIRINVLGKSRRIEIAHGPRVPDAKGIVEAAIDGVPRKIAKSGDHRSDKGERDSGLGGEGGNAQRLIAAHAPSAQLDFAVPCPQKGGIDLAEQTVKLCAERASWQLIRKAKRLEIAQKQIEQIAIVGIVIPAVGLAVCLPVAAKDGGFPTVEAVVKLLVRGIHPVSVVRDHEADGALRHIDIGGVGTVPREGHEHLRVLLCRLGD